MGLMNFFRILLHQEWETQEKVTEEVWLVSFLEDAYCGFKRQFCCQTDQENQAFT